VTGRDTTSCGPVGTTVPFVSNSSGSAGDGGPDQRIPLAWRARVRPTRAKRRPWAVKPEPKPRKGTPHERVTKTHSAATVDAAGWPARPPGTRRARARRVRLGCVGVVPSVDVAEQRRLRFCSGGESGCGPVDQLDLNGRPQVIREGVIERIPDTPGGRGDTDVE
jgi:hypothetical protein